MTDLVDRELGFIETVMHAVRLQHKANQLQAQATEALQVAIDLMAAVDADMLDAALGHLRQAGVAGRRPMTDELRRRRARQQVAPGTKIRRSELDDTPWPKAPAWVYVLLATDHQVLYIGKTISPRTRLATHSARGIPWTEVELIACATEAAALALEGDLIYQHQPPWNRADIQHRRQPS